MKFWQKSAYRMYWTGIKPGTKDQVDLGFVTKGIGTRQWLAFAFDNTFRGSGNDRFPSFNTMREAKAWVERRTAFPKPLKRSTRR